MGGTGRRVAGLVLLVVLVVAVVALFVIRGRSGSDGASGTTSGATSGKVVTLTGVIGSEKKPFFDDPAVKRALARHGLRVTVETAGSRQIATSTTLSSYDFAFPSSAPAAQKILDRVKSSASSSSYSPFYSPMAIASYTPVMQLLARNGVASQDAAGVWHVDMNAYLALVQKGTRWNQLDGAAQLYNSPRSVLISSTDIRTSNSAAMYLAIASYTLNGGNVVSSKDAEQAVLPMVSKIFLAQGFSASSSEEPFSDYLSQGSGALPRVMIYEAQFVGEAAATDSRITPDMVLAYPDPTVFSKHTLIPLDSKATKLGKLLTDDATLQSLEAQHGFRTADPKAFTAVAAAHHVAAATSLTDVADPPSYDELESMISAVARQYGS